MKQKYDNGSIQNQAHKNCKTPDITLETLVWEKPTKRGFIGFRGKRKNTTKITVDKNNL
jgi:hypothetical protein